MSPTLTDANAAAGDPADGLAVLESRGSTAETFGIPLAVLAELTHRCPLQCPYCSNPVELDRGGSELTTEEWKKVLSRNSPKSACCRSISPAASPPRARTWSNWSSTPAMSGCTPISSPRRCC